MATSLVIVALPAEDDYVNKISSQQAAHMTLLFLGDVSKVQNLDRITSFVEHAANQMLNRFSLSVDRRGVLGADSADVIFFKEHGYCFNDINNFRYALLQDNDIKMAYLSNNQHEEWQPHLTLGYPDSPAKSDDRDYPGIYYVNFDRIAVWYKEFDGDEFLLESDDEYMMMSVGENVVGEILEHHGVLGMRWGHRSGTATAVSAGRKGPSSSNGNSRVPHLTDQQKSTAKKVAIGVGVAAVVVGGAYVAYKLKQSGNRPVHYLNDGSSSEGRIAVKGFDYVSNLNAEKYWQQQIGTIPTHGRKGSVYLMNPELAGYIK